MIDLTRLQAIADAAYEGPWVTDAPMMGERDERYVGMLPYGNRCNAVVAAPNVATAEHIATFDPPTVKALLAVVEAAREVADDNWDPDEIPDDIVALRAALEPFRDTEGR